MDLLRLFRDYGVESAGPEHHHISNSEWVGIHCPFCPGQRNFHLGIHQQSLTCHCWRCGNHRISDVLERLTGTSYRELLTKYGEDKAGRTHRRRYQTLSLPKKAEAGRQKVCPLELPSGFLTRSLRPNHARYLERRGFDPIHLQREWGLTSTLPTARLGKAWYGNSIFIPIHWHGHLVSFQVRALKADKYTPKYRACPRSQETHSLRQLLYRHPDTTSNVGICVEGATDVWRLGRHAFAVLGIEYSPTHITLIAQLYRKVMILFDPERQAQSRAGSYDNSIVRQLVELGVDAWVQKLPDSRDPAELNDREVEGLINELLSR